MLGRNDLAYLTAVNEYEATAKSDPFELDDILDFAGATVLDVGVSLVNSLSWVGTLGQAGTEFDTGEILHGLNEDAGRYYDQHKDLVQLASFVGGIFVPGMAAAKTMKWAKQGRTFIGKSERLIKENQTKALDTFAKGSETAAEYKAARTSMRLNTLGQGVAEGAIYEAEFALMMNQHAYMDNNYSAVDYAIGAGLGALVGPLRLMQQSKTFKAAKAKIREGQLMDNFTVHTGAQGENAGQTLSLDGYQYNNWKVDDTSKMSQDVQQAHIIAEREHINNISRQINKMSIGPELKAKINYTVTSSAEVNPRNYNWTDALNEKVSPDEFLGKMTVSSPDITPGIDHFRLHNAETPMLSTAESIVRQGADGTIDISSGAMARELIVGQYIGRAPRSLETVMAAIPDTIELKLLDGIETIHTLDKVDKATKQWIADYLGLPSVANKPIKITGNTSDFKFNKTAINREGVLRELEATKNHDTFVSYDNLLDKLAPEIASSRAAIADPFFGANFMSEIEALSAAGVASYPSLAAKINTKAQLSSKIDAIPFQHSSAKVDAAWLEGQHAYINSHKLQEVLLAKNEGLLYKLQGIINGTGEGQFPKVVVKDTDLVFTTREEASKYLWEAKQELVTEGKVWGASPPQIARHTNLPIESVEAILTARGTTLPFDETLDISRYLKNDPAHYLDQVPIQAEGQLQHYGPIEELRASSMLDSATIDGIDESLSRTVIEKAQIPGGELSQYMDEVLFSPQMKMIKDQLAKVLSFTENRWNLITSNDQAMRELGDLGEIITTLGNDAISAPNAHVRRLKEAIVPSATAVAQDLASNTQFSAFRQALHAIPSEGSAKLLYNAELGKVITGVVDGKPTFLKHYGKDQEIIFTPQMRRFIEAWLPVQRELLELHNTARELVGLPRTPGAGIWLPYSELHKEFVAYKVAKKPGSIPETISARSASDLQEQVAAEISAHGHTHDIITKAGDSASWSQLNRYADLDNYRMADISAKKSGIAPGQLTPGITDITNLMASVQSDVWSKYRSISKSANSTIHNTLDFFAQRALTKTGGGTGTILQKVQRKVSMPELVSATLLNKSMVQAFPVLDMANNITTVGVNALLTKTSQIWDGVRSKLPKEVGLEDEYSKLTDALTEANIPMPWKDLPAYKAALKAAKIDNVALHRIQQSQSVLVALNLRLLEASHAAVTTLSLPVILQGELAHVKGKGGVYPLKHMMKAGKWWAGNSAEAIAVKAYAYEKKYTQSIVAETTRMMQDFNIGEDVFTKHKGIIKKLSFLSDFSEGWVREQAFANGYLIAKQKFPTAPMEVLASHAYAFTSRTMGNYVPRQRPALFQGTFGSMVGLYQTFMLTMGQNMFRYLEAGDAKAMSNLWAGQAGMFGFESLPFFQQFNKLMGGYFSDDHEDFRATIYNAFGDDTEQSRSAAEFALFGLPSTIFGAGIYTRATLDPRTPVSISDETGVSFKPAVFDAAMQTGELVYNLAVGSVNSMKPGGSIVDLPTSILQGFAAQSLWRPAARLSELAMGRSYDRKGELISTPEAVYEPFAMFSRAIGARPLREQALRNLRFSNSYYNTVDRDRKATVVKQLRRVVTEDPDDNQITDLFNRYIEAKGTYKGWKQIYNTAYMSVDTPYADRMLNANSKQPVIQDIVDTYAN